jgi:hypothetical protein
MKRESATSVSPILPEQPEDDPFVRDADPSRQRKRSTGRRRDGWFSGQITWVVYTMTIIQLAVFIAELAKNGTQGSRSRFGTIWLTSYC